MSIPRIHVAARFLDEGRVDEALPILERLVALFPFYATPFTLLARTHELKGNSEEALAAWRKAHFLLPENEMVRAGIRRNSRRLLSEVEDPIDQDPIDIEIADADELEASLRQVTLDVVDVPESFEGDREETRSSDAPPDFLELDDLDGLIAELEGGRIEPNLDPDELPDPMEDYTTEEVVSETLARIYLNQEQHTQAARIYRILASQRPERAGAYLEKAEELEDLARRRGTGAYDDRG